MFVWKYEPTRTASLLCKLYSLVKQEEVAPTKMTPWIPSCVNNVPLVSPMNTAHVIMRLCVCVMTIKKALLFKFNKTNWIKTYICKITRDFFNIVIRRLKLFWDDFSPCYVDIFQLNCTDDSGNRWVVI